jgi:hypothetical protein
VRAIRVLVSSVLFAAMVLFLAPGRAEADTWGACGLRTNDAKIIRTYTAVAGIRRVYLKCGGPKYSARPDWGYRHILWKHRGDFEGMARGTYQNWRDLADLGMESALIDPAVRGGVVDGKRCFSRSITLYNRQTGAVVRKQIVRVVFKVSDQTIITAYPSSRHC